MEQNDFINGCIKVENFVASIYNILMETFPDKKEFWGSLLHDEIDHIAFLKDIKSLALADHIKKMDKQPTLGTINKTLRLADYIRDDINTDAISFKDALALTLKLEESMVEIYTNEVIAKLLSCDDEEPIAKVIADEKSHINKIRNMMKQV